MKIKFFGGAKEVGRSCIQLKSKDGTFLFDAGIKLENGVEFPILPQLNELDSVFISHAHLDHTGALPYFKSKGLRTSVYCTAGTYQITKLLLDDSFKIAKKQGNLNYSKQDVQNSLNLFELKNLRTKYNLSGKAKNVSYEFFDAGHIPGSTSIVLEMENRRILYTGDINTEDTNLLKKADIDYGKIDVMICESTYGDRNHPDRKISEKEFLDKVKEVSDNGFCLIPAFAVGRAQEIILMLNKRNFKNSIFLDGMALKATKMFLSMPDTLRDVGVLRAALRAVEPVDNFQERKEIQHHKFIAVTTSGMLNGGPVIEYLKSIVFKKDSSILLTGYQAEETNGRMLLEEHKIELDGWVTNVKSNVSQYDFSAHAGMNNLKCLIKKVNPGILILNHGESKSIKSLALFAQKQGIRTIIPTNGDEFEV